MFESKVKLRAYKAKRVMFEFDEYSIRYNDERYYSSIDLGYAGEINIHLLNMLDVAEIKWSIDYFAFVAEVQKKQIKSA